MSIQKHLTANDFILIVRPVLGEVPEEEVRDKLGAKMQPLNEEPLQHWTGEVQVGIVADEENSELSEEEFTSMITLCNCAAASIPAMEENSFIREIIQIYSQRHLITPVPESLKSYTDNILTLATDTKGNA